MLVELKLSNNWKRRLLGWARDLILIFGMWSIWLVRNYLAEPFIENVVTIFLVIIISLTILVREYVDYTIIALEAQLFAIKNK